MFRNISTMNKPKLFISHSTSGLPSTDRCVEIKEYLYESLSERGWDVFVDNHRINPGDKWRTEIIYNLAHTQAGIILFNERACSQSDWVTAEALILCFRKSIDPKFQIIPVLLKDKKLHDTCFERYKPFQLNEIQVIKEDQSLSSKDFANQIAARFDINDVGLPSTNQWVTRVISLLKEVDVDALMRAAKKLDLLLEEGLNNPHMDYQNKLSRALVELMHHKPPLENIGAFHELLTQLDAEKAKRLSLHLAAKWVENEATEILHCASRKPNEIGLLTINTKSLEVTQQYLNRAKIEICGVQTFSVSGAAGEGEDAILYKIEQTICEQLFPSGSYIGDDYVELPPIKSIAKYLNSQTKVVICVLPSEYAKERILKVLRQRYPGIIFIVQVGSQEEMMKMFNSIGGTPLYPPLNFDKYNSLIELKYCLSTAMKAHFLGG